MNSNRVRKDCFKKGNTLSFNEAREMAKAEESADKQLQLMNTAVEVHPVTSENRSPNQRDQVRSKPKMAIDGAKHQPAGIVAGVLMHVNSAQQRMQRVTTVRR